MNMRLVMNSNGTLQYFTRVNESAQWDLSWLEPHDLCNVFRACGNSASCNSKNNKSMCKCLPGFEPISPHNWDSRDFSEGCRRSLPICSNKVEKIQSFRPLQVIKVGKADMDFDANSENECKKECLKGCNCQAYSFKMPENSQLRYLTVAIVIALAFTVFYIYTGKAIVNKKVRQTAATCLHHTQSQPSLAARHSPAARRRSAISAISCCSSFASCSSSISHLCRSSLISHQSSRFRTSLVCLITLEWVWSNQGNKD
ncbi:hypothetical protein EZV62_020548 [Acer yangbiense]|uniref:Apple domain-containing protein n=1 Tax=Acer yangbiense TaxID=1000413 RepID=A0A5C7HFV7_9ROSI|nr:hypothetical protein EZV62_020548 [Acer yangbiense]